MTRTPPTTCPKRDPRVVVRYDPNKYELVRKRKAKKKAKRIRSKP